MKTTPYRYGLTTPTYDPQTAAELITARTVAQGQPAPSRAASRGPVRVLGCVVKGLDPKTRKGKFTAHQLGGSAMYTERHVRACLTTLETLGLIEWERGGIQRGGPAPSRIYVPRNVLAQVFRVDWERVRASRST